MKVGQLMSRNPTTVTEDEDLATALSVMLWSGVHHLPVVRDGRVLGVLTHHDLLASREPGTEGLRLRGSVRDVMSLPPITIGSDETVETAAAKLSVDRLGCLPVVEGERLVGILTITDLLAHFATDAVDAPAPAEKASDVMATDPIFTTREQPLAVATGVMFEHGIRHLPVLDESHRVVGMLSDRDVRSAFGNPLLAKLQPQLKVEDAMTYIASVASPDDSIASLRDLFLDTRVGAIPVVDPHEKLVGIVSYLDLLRVAL